jgi:hypothetical protein
VKRPSDVLIVLIVVVVVSACALAALLARAETIETGHNVASIPDQAVLSDATLLRHARAAIDQFQARAGNVLRQMDEILAKPAGQVGESDLAELADQVNMLIMLRYAVGGTGAQLEERLASKAGFGFALLAMRPVGFGGTDLPSLGAAFTGVAVTDDLTQGVADTYARFATDFDTALKKMMDDADGSASPASGSSGGSSSGVGGSSGASVVSTAQLTTDGLVVQAEQSLRDTVGGTAAQVQSTLKELAQQLGQ